jgi:hypothetical protein
MNAEGGIIPAIVGALGVKTALTSGAPAAQILGHFAGGVDKSFGGQAKIEAILGAVVVDLQTSEAARITELHAGEQDDRPVRIGCDRSRW